MRDVNVLSLFTGAGGLDLGFHECGFKIVGCVEIEKAFCKTLEYNKSKNKFIWPDCKIFNEDITHFDPTVFSDSKIDFVIGGPPCQTYSASGRRIGGAPGLDDERGRLFEHYCRILKQLNPRGFLFENVRGLFGVNGGEAWQAVVNAFSELGYNLFYAVLDAAAYGVPQHRERIFLVGVRTDQTFLFPRPLFGPDSPHKTPYVCAGAAINDLQDDNEPYHEYDGKYGYLLSGIPEGMNYSFYTAEMGHPSPVFAWRSKFSSFLYKIAQNRPVKTIQAQLGKFAGPFHWKNRRLTIAELKRLQSFPDDYEFFGSYNVVAEQIGNSVPPRLATYLAQAVMRQIFDPSSYQELELMPSTFKQTFDARKGEAASRTRTLTLKAKALKPQLTLWEEDRVVNISIEQTDFVDHEKFFCTYTDPTNRAFSSKPENTKLLESKNEIFTIATTKTKQSNNYLKVKIENADSKRKNLPHWQTTAQLFSPLRDGVDTIEVTLVSYTPNHIYVVWDVIEELIRKRSAYISIVALYGHFSEPRAKFSSSVINLMVEESEIAKLICYYSDFSKCGKNLAGSVIARDTGIDKTHLPLLMRQLRNIRYDIRSNQTNSRIPEEHYFCAYPFTELSASYQVNKAV